MPQLVVFFGAGASKPFGIPTMKEMVTEFEDGVVNKAAETEQNLYTRVKQFLVGNYGYADLESVFTVVEGIAKKVSLQDFGYMESFYLKASGVSSHYKASEEEIVAASSLRGKFEDYVRSRCEIREEQQYRSVESIFFDFFGSLSQTALPMRGGPNTPLGHFNLIESLVFYTTNYDTSLEYFWREFAQTQLNTGFQHDPIRNAVMFDSNVLDRGDLTLVKLHGSVNWFLRDDGLITEEYGVPVEGRTYGRRKFLGRMMVYPIQEKALYLEPFFSMIHRLKRDLGYTNLWLVIGYSFNDLILRQIFAEHSHGKHIVVVHPRANSELAPKLKELKGRVDYVDGKFGIPETNAVILKALRS